MESASFWSAVAAIGFTAAGAVAGIFAWYFSYQVSGAKDAKLAEFQRHSTEAIATADSRAATANAQAAAANQRASEANERAELVGKDAAALAARAAQAELRLATLTNLAINRGHRILNDEGLREFAKTLHRLAG